MNKGRKTVAVIGAGMVGVAAASYLQRDGHDVVIIDPEPPGQGASFGNAGCFNPSSVVPVAGPNALRKIPGYLADPLGPLAIRWSYLPKLTPWLIRHALASTPARTEAQARALKSLLGPCLHTLMPLVRDAGAESLVARDGILIVYRSEAAWQADQSAWDLRRRNGIAWDELSADDLRQFDPSLTHDLIRGRHVPGNGHSLNPGGLVVMLAAAVQNRGGRLLCTRATGFSLDGNRLRAVQTTNGEVPASAAVISCGAHSKPLAAGLGNTVPLESERGYHLMIRNPEAMPRLPTNDADYKFVATPMQEGLRLAGTVEFAGLAAKPNWERSRMMLRFASKLCPALSASYPEDRTSMWMGHRPEMPDSLPVIGPSRRSPDVFYAFGHGHVGMTGAPYTGIVIANLVAGRPAPIDLTPFRPDRF
jgi:D-amino-acid dehydrogenase